MGLYCSKELETTFKINFVRNQGRNHWGVGWVRTPQKLRRTTPAFYVAVDCSARNWVYHPYFVLYNNLDQGIGPPTLKTWLRPCEKPLHIASKRTVAYRAVWLLTLRYVYH